MCKVATGSTQLMMHLNEGCEYSNTSLSRPPLSRIPTAVGQIPIAHLFFRSHFDLVKSDPTVGWQILTAGRVRLNEVLLYWLLVESCQKLRWLAVYVTQQFAMFNHRRLQFEAKHPKSCEQDWTVVPSSTGGSSIGVPAGAVGIEQVLYDLEHGNASKLRSHVASL